MATTHKPVDTDTDGQAVKHCRNLVSNKCPGAVHAPVSRTQTELFATLCRPAGQLRVPGRLGKDFSTFHEVDAPITCIWCLDRVKRERGRDDACA